jgi:phosphoglycerate dehydrogenase-like enzyme
MRKESMKILFAAPENAWGGFLGMLRAALPGHRFAATGGFRVASLADTDVLIPTMCPVTADLLAGSQKLRLIQQCGAGLEGVDINAAAQKKIWVANVPTDISGNADSVAEIGIYFMIGLARQHRKMAPNLAAGKMGEPQGASLKGRTVGIVGLGGIGCALARRLVPFGVRLIGIKRSGLKQIKQELGLQWVGKPADLPALLAQSDFVVLTLPLTPDSQDLISDTALAAMRPDSYLINLSRGGVVNRAALARALEENRIAGAGLDVFWEEPPDPADPIFTYNVMATPHIGGVTDLSMNGIVQVVAENIRRVQRGEKPLYTRQPAVGG